MRRTITLLVLLAACGGATPAPSSAPGSDAPPGPAPSSTSASPGVTPSPGSGPTTTAAHDREPAPDFTLELGEGGSYTLSEGSKPVYLVFWAEW